MRRMDHKLARIRDGQYRPADFIIADAKDGDMAFGRAAPGPLRTPEGPVAGRYRSRRQYLDAMAELVRSDLVDIMLMSASSAETLVGSGLFAGSPVTPAVRLNDTTDIWGIMRGSRYGSEACRPFRTARLDRVRALADLGLYSVTFNNDLERDLASLTAYAEFRLEASADGMRHFLEVFNPNVDAGLAGDELGAFINDSIIRALAGVTSADRPLFLKIAYNGPRAMEELSSYDPIGLIVGILGGGKGTTRDTFELLAQAERHGARVALFGRKINLTESPVDLIGLMRRVVERDATPAEAVKAYHDALGRRGLRPDRNLGDDLEITDPVLKGA